MQLSRKYKFYICYCNQVLLKLMGIIRNTKSVKVLLNEFEKCGGAISAIDLITRLNSKLNKTTVYRVLEKLEDDGILHSFLNKNGIKWYAKCKDCSKSKHTDVHPHFECLNCGKMDCLNDLFIVPKVPNRKIIHDQILIQGHCELCF